MQSWWFKDPQFGVFAIDRITGHFQATVKWNGTEVCLAFAAVNSAPSESALAVARALWSNQAIWTKKVEDYAVSELLPLKNESWLEDGDPEVTTKKFVKRLTLEDVTIQPDGIFEFVFDDGDLFWGHAVFVTGTLNGGLEKAEIVG